MKKIIITIFAIACSFNNMAQASEWTSQRGSIEAALTASEREELGVLDRNSLSEHPLFSWLEVLSFKKRLNAKLIHDNDRKDIEATIQRYPSMAAGDWLRNAYLNYLSSQKDWTTFSRFYRGSDDTDLQCGDLNARMAQNKIDDVWIADTQKIWLSG